MQLNKTEKGACRRLILVILAGWFVASSAQQAPRPASSAASSVAGKWQRLIGCDDAPNDEELANMGDTFHKTHVPPRPLPPPAQPPAQPAAPSAKMLIGDQGAKDTFKCKRNNPQ